MDKRDKIIIPDISEGQEAIPIPVVNNYNTQRPKEFTYLMSNISTAKADELSNSAKWENSTSEGCNCEGECRPSTCECEKASDFVFMRKSRIVMEPHVIKTYDHKYVNCSSKCVCRSKCKRQLLPSYVVKKTFLKYVPKMGFGVFANQPIAIGQPVCEYVGKVALRTEGQNPDTIYQLTSHVYDESNKDEFVIDAMDCGNVSRFLNHCCMPNLWPVRVYSRIPDSKGLNPLPRIVLVAILNIKPGDELTFSYGASYFTLKNMPCYCCGPVCYVPPKNYYDRRERYDEFVKRIKGNTKYVNKHYQDTKDIEFVVDVLD